MGVSPRGVSVFSQLDMSSELDGRGHPSHIILSQLQHAFVQTQKTDSRFFTEVRFHVSNQTAP